MSMDWRTQDNLILSVDLSNKNSLTEVWKIPFPSEVAFSVVLNLTMTPHAVGLILNSNRNG